MNANGGIAAGRNVIARGERGRTQPRKASASFDPFLTLETLCLEMFVLKFEVTSLDAQSLEIFSFAAAMFSPI